MTLKRRRKPVGVLAVIEVLMAVGFTAVNPASAAPLPPAADAKPVIVILKNQHQDLSAKTAGAQRRAVTQNDQAPLVAKVRATGARDMKTFSIVNGFAALLSPAQMNDLKADPNVADVVPDRMIPFVPFDRAQRADMKAQAKQALDPDADHTLPGTCPADPAKPLLEPEALQTTQTEFTDTNRPQAHSIVDGTGVKVAWIADGIDVNNPDFIRADGARVFTDYQDFSGTDASKGGSGAEAFGDASSIAAQGRQVYDLSKFVSSAHPLPAGCNIRVKGIAPGASLVGLNVFGASDFVATSLIIQAIDYAVTVDNVDVINESLGNNTYPTTGIDPVSLADDAAVAAGVTVVAATGDAGPSNTVGNPAVDPNVISTGSVTSYRLMGQTGFAGARTFATSFASENASALSSDGTTALGRVPDLVAPGEEGWSVCTADPVRFASCADFNGKPSNLEAFGGTSEAAPFVAGGAALVIQAYQKTHGGVRPSPALVKQVLTSSATDLGLPATQQGSGELNTYRAVQLAMSIQDTNGTPVRTGDALLLGTPGGDTQLTASGPGGASRDVALKVTNTAPFTQNLTAHGRVLDSRLSDTKATIGLDTRPTSGNPSFPDGVGTPDGPIVRRYAKTTFNVPPGADHLSGQLSWPGGTANGQSAVHLALIGPLGEYEAHSAPQGSGNHGQVDVRNPIPGQWTAVFFATESPTGFHGTVQYEFTTTKYRDFGTMSPTTLRLQPGQSGTFHVAVKLPRDAGDLSAAVEVDNGFHGRASIPLTLRTLLASGDGGAFSGTITGGNGRSILAAQTESYVFDVPAGKKDLGVDLTLKGDPNQQVQAALLSPDNQVLSLSTNQVLGANGDPVGTASLQGYVRAPAPGRWTLFLDVDNPVAGTSLSEQFTGHLKYNLVDVNASGLPAGTVPAGKPVTVKLTVRNTGVATERYFADPRLTSYADYDLIPTLDSTDTTSVPVDPAKPRPTWQVPTESTNLTVQQGSTIPADFDLVKLSNGIPELYGRSQGMTAVASIDAPRLSQGLWSAVPTPLGPTNGTVSGSAVLHARVHTQAFDASAVADTGDAWQRATNVKAPFTPLVLAPGQSGTITVTITVTGAKGTTHSGLLYVDNFSDSLASGDELAALPYSYTIG